MSEMSGCATAVLGGRAQIEGGFVDLAVALDGTIAAHVEEQTTISARGSGKVGWDGLVVATTHGEPLMLRRNRRVTAYAVAPDGRLAADADETGEIRITDLRAGRPLPSLQADSAVEGLGFDGTGLVLAFRTKGSIGIADPRAPATVRSIAAVEPRALALSDDGSRLAVCGDDRLTVFATDTLAAVASATSDAGVGELRFLARGEALLSTGRERVELHRSGDLSSVRRFAFDEFIVTCQVAPDERYLAVQGSRMLRAWRLEDGLPIAELPTGPGTSFAFGLEGWLLVANDSRVDRLPLSPELVVKMVRDRIGRPLTPQEWADAVPDEPYVTATATPQT